MDTDEIVLTVYDDPPVATPPRADERIPMPETSPAAAPAPTPAPDAVVATTEVAAPTAASDLTALAQATGGDSTLTIVLALVAVVGGGAAFKFYSSFSAQKHEQAMKKLEIAAAANGANGAQPPACQAANAAIESELTEIRARLAGVEKKALSLSADFDAEDLERQVKRIAKAVKALQDAST